MEPTPISDQVHDFMKACRGLAGFAHAHNGLTDVEREIVRTVVLALEQEIGSLSPQPSMGDPPLDSTLSNPPRSTDS